ncbi:MAG TPA: serine hydrolase [Gemmatimonadaceae bacterium]|nr:serine hydrolase [Gemmatimonadaceae bacterium]
MVHLFFLAAALAATGVHTGTDSLAAQIRARVARLSGVEVGVAYRNLGAPGDTLYLDADSSMHAASTMKVPVMIQVFRQVDAGALSLDQPVLLVNQFSSIVDGSPYSLDAGDDSDSSMYARVGTRVSVRELMSHMIERSSNLATDAVIALVGAKNVQHTMHELGAMRIRVLRGVEDLKAFDKGMNNTTTARDLATILAAIQENRAASAKSCAAMRTILLKQEFHSEIPAGLPPGTPVAHKTGWITGIHHDAAIVYPRGSAPYVLVVLTHGITDDATADTLIADISRMVYQHATAQATAGD